MQRLRAATVTVADVDASVALYRDWMDYVLLERGRVAPAMALSWGCPASAGADCAVMRPAGGDDVLLRFVAGAPVPDYVPLRSFGWAAVELCVQDVLEVQARMEQSPFAIIGPAKELAGLPTIFPMQVRGPDREIVYLTEIRGDLPDYDLPRARSLIDRPFILVLACSDMAASAAWFADTLGFGIGRDMAIPYTMLADAFGQPHEKLYTLCTMSDGRDVFLELDQYPAEAAPRVCSPAVLPPGPSLATFLHPAPETIAQPFLAPLARRHGAIYGGAVSGTLRAPDGSLVEVVGPG